MASPAKGGRDAVGDLRKDWEGREVDGLRFGPCLGSSGYSAVFRTDRGVIKLLRVDPEDRQFSVLERVMTFSHPHLARVLAAGRCGKDLLYVLTEYAEEDLAQVLPVRPLTVAETRDMLDPLLTALSYLHGQGLVHGRLNPSNIWVVDGNLKLSSDRVIPAGTRLATGKLRTVYDAPETADGLITPAADVWSLGVTMVEALTQQRPLFDGSDLELPETLPPDLRAMAVACLDSDPRRRIGVRELWTRLHPGGTPAPATGKRIGKRAVVIGVAAAAAITGVTLVGRRSPKAEDPSEVATRAAEEVLARLPKQAAKPAPAPAQPQAAAAPEQAAQAVVSQDQIVERVMPTDPARGLRTIRGTVRVAVLVQVDSSGQVSEARLDSPGPSRYFAARALEAAQRWRFAPAQGNVGARTWRLRFEFRNRGVEVSARPSDSVR
ncbi:MAG TPA: TonB family protein [Bryobacteraceae bacterium]|nr:TonB family protein [Bryobacteraceae bacterium]